MQTIMKTLSRPFYMCSEGIKRWRIEDGKIELDPEGKTGAKWLISVWKEIDWNKYATNDHKKKFVKYLTGLKDNVLFVDKWIVMPAGYRDYRHNDRGSLEFDEINEFYGKILAYNSGSDQFLQKDSGGDDIGKASLIQKVMNELHNYLVHDKLSKKGGIIQQNGYSKRVDFAARLVLNSDSLRIPMNGCGIPWHVMINLFAPFLVSHIKEDPALLKQLGLDEYSNFDDYGKQLHYIYNNLREVLGAHKDLKEKLIKILEKVLDENPELRVFIKRDPAWGPESFWTLVPIINKGDEYNGVLNGLLYTPLGGDCVNYNLLVDAGKETSPEGLVFENGMRKVTSFKNFPSN